MPEKTRFDAIVIGTGQAGPSLAGRLAGAGMKVAIVEGWLKGMENVAVLEGHARFEGPRQVRVGDEVLEADRFFVNVGGRAVQPEGFEGAGALNNSTMIRRRSWESRSWEWKATRRSTPSSTSCTPGSPTPSFSARSTSTRRCRS